ncbi:hypothetical protein K1719_035202 [Acacia pycnantha]|nr:hypothetical protein K1719_035202 [Acacia pycnantha]
MDPAGMDVNAEVQMMTALILYQSTHQGNWNEALTAFKNNPGFHKMPINSSGDTLLHVALSEHKEVDRAEEIVDEIKKKQSWSVLETKNNRGDTPLHCAASIGSLKMCKAIAQALVDRDNTRMVEARNKNGETPLFLAALHGHMDAFLYLHDLWPDQSNRLWKRAGDGETVLHCTICREHFDLAFQIILLYKDYIVGSVDENGITPLHILASKPSAFEKSSNFSWYNKLVYNCLIVKPLMGSREQQSNNNDTLLNRQVLCNKESPDSPGFVALGMLSIGDHKDLVQKSDEWLCRTSESCSVVAALVAGVAFATSSTVPGGNDDKTGKPTLEGQPGFDLFAVSALIALCFSVTALILFLSILTSRKHPADFMKRLPVKLFIALSSLFVSIFSMFISFCAAHSFVLEEKSMKSVLLLYAIICRSSRFLHNCRVPALHGSFQRHFYESSTTVQSETYLEGAVAVVLLVHSKKQTYECWRYLAFPLV